MTSTSARVLSLLSVLTAGATVTGRELADRFGVSPRTVRRDVETLRELGFAVEPVKGAGGGYRLGARGALPPLVLDDEQAVAVAVALQTAPAVLSGIEGASARALETIRQVMSPRLRREADALTVTALPNLWEFPATPPGADLVRIVGAAVRQRLLVRVSYDDPEPGADDLGVLEPHHLVVWAARWYLIAFQRRGERWRVLRLDRVTRPEVTGIPFAPRELPPGGPEALVQGTAARGDRLAPWPCVGSAVLALPADLVARFTPGGAVVRAVGPDACELSMGAWSWVGLAGLFVTFASPLSRVEPRELREAFAVAAQHLHDGARAAT